MSDDKDTIDQRIRENTDEDGRLHPFGIGAELKVLEFPGPTDQVDNGWAEETLANVSAGITERASEDNDPVVGIAVVVAYESGTVGHNWAGSHRVLLVGGLQYMQRMVMEEEG